MKQQYQQFHFPILTKYAGEYYSSSRGIDLIVGEQSPRTVRLNFISSLEDILKARLAEIGQKPDLNNRILYYKAISSEESEIGIGYLELCDAISANTPNFHYNEYQTTKLDGNQNRLSLEKEIVLVADLKENDKIVWVGSGNFLRVYKKEEYFSKKKERTKKI